MWHFSEVQATRALLTGALLVFGTGGPPAPPFPVTSAIRGPLQAAGVSISSPAAADSALSLELNLPAFRLEAREHGVLIRTWDVAVGMPGYRTPRGAFSVTQVEWNPWWIPPDREWARDERPTPPGPANPMGKVKLHFTPLYFLHGTPSESSMGQAASHGCIRMRNADAIDLALLVHSRDSAGVATATLDSLIGNRTPRVFVLAWPVPLTLRYELAELRTDSLILYPDVYRLFGGSSLESAWNALLQHGVDTGIVRKPVLLAAVRAARRARVVVAVDSLVPARESH